MKTTPENELYNIAVKKNAVSRAFDRVFIFVSALLVIGIVCYIGFFQYQYQEQSRRITQARNEQLQQILQSNEETKALIRCAVTTRSDTNPADAQKVADCAKTTVEVVPEVGGQ